MTNCSIFFDIFSLLSRKRAQDTPSPDAPLLFLQDYRHRCAIQRCSASPLRFFSIDSYFGSLHARILFLYIYTVILA